MMCIYGIYQQPGQTDTTEFSFFQLRFCLFQHLRDCIPYPQVAVHLQADEMLEHMINI